MHTRARVLYMHFIRVMQVSRGTVATSRNCEAIDNYQMSVKREERREYLSPFVRNLDNLSSTSTPLGGFRGRLQLTATV